MLVLVELLRLEVQVHQRRLELLLEQRQVRLFHKPRWHIRCCRMLNHNCCHMMSHS